MDKMNEKRKKKEEDYQCQLVLEISLIKKKVLEITL